MVDELKNQLKNKTEEYQELELTCVDSIQKIGNSLNFIKS
jgi:hypothetical protein